MCDMDEEEFQRQLKEATRQSQEDNIWKHEEDCHFSNM
jgi:hypothetical protein